MGHVGWDHWAWRGVLERGLAMVGEGLELYGLEDSAGMRGGGGRYGESVRSATDLIRWNAREWNLEINCSGGVIATPVLARTVRFVHVNCSMIGTTGFNVCY